MYNLNALKETTVLYIDAFKPINARTDIRKDKERPSIFHPTVHMGS